LLTLFRAETQLLASLALDSTLGWSDLVDGKVSVRVVPGNHHTMTTEPYWFGTSPKHSQQSLMRLKDTVDRNGKDARPEIPNS
jgi:thioesterase domain-containing protein